MHDGNVGSIVCSGSEQQPRGTPRAVLEPSRLGCPPLVGRDYLHGFRAMLGDWELGSGNWQSGIGNRESWPARRR